MAGRFASIKRLSCCHLIVTTTPLARTTRKRSLQIRGWSEGTLRHQSSDSKHPVLRSIGRALPTDYYPQEVLTTPLWNEWSGKIEVSGSSAQMEIRIRRVSPCEFPELMDGDCSYEDFRDCLRSLERINRWLLGYRPTLTWLERLPRGLHEPIHIVDVGRWRWRSTAADFRLGTETGRGCAINGNGLKIPLDAAPAWYAGGFENTWVTGDAREYGPEKPIDIVVSSLLAHHLEDEEIVALLRRMEATVQLGWFINDLERAQWSFRMFGMVRWHPIVRHDGPVSFRRAFRKEDWVRLLAAAEVPREIATVERWRPGRLCVGRWK